MGQALDLCGGCRFFLARKRLPPGAAMLAGVDPKEGRCRRFPQEVTKSADAWCGEFERRKA